MSLACTGRRYRPGDSQLPEVVDELSSELEVEASTEVVAASELGSTGVLSVIAGSVDPGELLPESSPQAGTMVSSSASAGAARRYRGFIRMASEYPWPQHSELVRPLRHRTHNDPT